MIIITNPNESDYDKLVETIEITEFKNLIELIKIDDDIELRDNFIFRGMKNVEYDLIPSALRKDDDDTKIINEFILDSGFHINLHEKITSYNLKGEEKTGFLHASIDKNEKPVLNKSKYIVKSKGELQFKREIIVLLKFLNHADKIGLKISSNPSIRQWLHNYLDYTDKEEIWPKSEFYEIISLAQHHGLPTRALDWSYDYKVALFFAVEDILNNQNSDCVLWAFNYKVFEEKNISNKIINKKDGLVIYRPEYNTNPNLKAQKGLFTFWTSNDYTNMDDDTPFDKLITEKIHLRNCKKTDKIRFIFNATLYEINLDEKIFYKFIISGNLKAKILKELYLEGYTSENIYPNYYQVVDSIKNRVKLEQILNQEK